MRVSKVIPIEGLDWEQPEAETPHVRLIFHIREREQSSCGPRQPRQQSEDMPGTQALLLRSTLRPQSHKGERGGVTSRNFPFDGKATQEPGVVPEKSRAQSWGKNETDDG